METGNIVGPFDQAVQKRNALPTPCKQTQEKIFQIVGQNNIERKPELAPLFLALLANFSGAVAQNDWMDILKHPTP